MEFKGKFPDRLRGYHDDEFLDAPVSGTTRIVFHGSKISIIFEANDGQRFSYTFPCCGEEYEEILFYSWPYDAKDCSEFLGGERTLPVWDVKDPGDCACLEHLAKEAEGCLIPILGNQDHKKLEDRRQESEVRKKLGHELTRNI